MLLLWMSELNTGLRKKVTLVFKAEEEWAPPSKCLGFILSEISL